VPSRKPHCANAQDSGRASSHDLSLLMYYAHLTRHYATTHQNGPEFWDSPSFILTKVSIRNLGENY
jgi:hypothetical protein